MTLFLYLCIMKKIITVLITMLIAINASAQSLSLTKINGKKSLVINMVSETDGYDKVEIILKEESIENFVNHLKNWKKKADKMSPSLSKRINFGKPIPGAVDYDFLYFNYKNKTNFASNHFLVPSLYVDNDSKQHFILRGYYKGEDEATSAKKNKAAKEICEFNYAVVIPLNELDSWISRIENKLLDIRFDPSK